MDDLQQVRLKVCELLDKCRECPTNYTQKNSFFEDFCAPCPTYKKMRKISGKLFQEIDYKHKRILDKKDNMKMSELRYLLNEGIPKTVIAKSLNMTVRQLKRILSGETFGWVSWSSEEERFVIENYKKMTAREMSEKIGRSQGAITEKVRQLGLRKEKA